MHIPPPPLIISDSTSFVYSLVPRPIPKMDLGTGLCIKADNFTSDIHDVDFS